jgi:hypothetical protein
MVTVGVNDVVPLRILSTDGRADLYGRIHIYDSAGALAFSLSALHVAEGMYSVNWTPSLEGYYSMVGQFFFDPIFTVDAGYERAGDLIEVNNVKSSILRLLGLTHDNAVIDNQMYDIGSNLISCRIRTYDSKPNAQAAGLTGLLYQWSVNATYSGNQLIDYKMVRDL